jgi:hypothetical protein
MSTETPAGGHATIGDECAAMCSNVTPEMKGTFAEAQLRPIMAFCFYSGVLAMWSHVSRTETDDAFIALKKDVMLGAHEAGLIKRKDMPAELLPLVDAKRTSKPN